MLHLISFEPSFPLTLTLSPREVCVYRGRCARERGAAFTPLPRGTVPVTLRIFPSAGNGRTVKRPQGRAPAALGRGAKDVPREREQQPPGVCFAHTLDFGASLELGAWNLELLRCLEPGIWSF